jgi:hypothetical protein
VTEGAGHARRGASGQRLEDLAEMMNVAAGAPRAHYAHGVSERTRRQIERSGNH